MEYRGDERVEALARQIAPNLDQLSKEQALKVWKEAQGICFPEDTPLYRSRFANQNSEPLDEWQVD